LGATCDSIDAIPAPEGAHPASSSKGGAPHSFTRTPPNSV
jgi:hypothetical protein